MPAHTASTAVLDRLSSVQNKIAIAKEEYEEEALSLTRVEFLIRQSIHTLKDIRRDLVRSGDM